MKATAATALSLWLATAAMAVAAGNAHDTDDGPAPGFDGQRALDDSQAAIGRALENLVLRERDGREVRLASLRGKPLVISLIYTSCYHICPTTTQHLARVSASARRALGEDSFNVVSIGFDARNDTPAAMREFARAQGVDDPRWQFLSADAATVERLAQDLGFIFRPSAKGFDHLIQATVIDAQGRVYRQVYGMNFEAPALVEPLKELVLGQAPSTNALARAWNKVRLFCTTYDPATGAYRFDYSLFVGGAIGALCLLAGAAYLVGEWRRQRVPRRV